MAGDGAPTQIELVWPGKYESTRPIQRQDGVWELTAAEPTKRRYPIVDLKTVGQTEGYKSNLFVIGDRIDALAALDRQYGRQVQLIYMDPPRIEVDDATAAFQGDSAARYSSWLSTFRAHVQAMMPLLRRDGFIAVQVADAEAPYARLVADEILARDNHVATIVWQRSYAPRNQKGMKEFTSTHECILVYAFDKAYVDAVGLRQTPDDYTNPDDDPRLAWRAQHKGARTRRDTTDFDTYVAPYRWRLVEGTLPPGLWRVSPLTGVVWGTPEAIGSFPIVVEVEDSEGNVAQARLEIEVVEIGESIVPSEIPWLFSPIKPEGNLRIVTTEVAPLIVGKPSSILLLADGGSPYMDTPKRPGEGRYWEFPDYTLLKAYLEDKVDLGVKGNAIPRIKSYESELGGDVEVQNQVTWWPGRKDKVAFAGYTQDATKHLKKLSELGLISTYTTTAKPELLLERLLSIFTEPGDVVLECFVSTADMAAVCMKRDRRFVHVHGTSNRETELLEGCALPRLQAVIDGKDFNLEGAETSTKVREDLYLPYEGGGGFRLGRVGDWLLSQGAKEDIPTINLESYSDPIDFVQALVTAEGYLPLNGESGLGISADGMRRCVVIPPDEYLTPDLSSDIASQSSGMRTTVYYFMSSEDFDPQVAPPDLSYRRVPMDLVV